MFRWPIMRSFDSFRRLTGLDYVDGLLLGWHNTNPDPTLLNVCRELKEKGLVRHIGVSGHNRKAFPEFARTGFYDFFHTRYNAAHRGGETEVFPLLPKDNRPGIVIYTATSWGQLLDPRKTPSGEKTPSGSDCYRFVMTNPSVDVCITGPKNMKEAEEALSSLDKGPMSPEEMDWMRRVGDSVHG
jgi:aryl-alcohol dehydrogenase-like predicted oxidoreductase